MSATVTRPVGSPTAAVKTSKVAGRRELHFTKLAEIQADAESLRAEMFASLAIGRWARRRRTWRGR